MNEEVRHFSLRKLSVGLASVLVGVSIFGASQTVKADTVADQTASAVTGSVQSKDTQENKNATESSFSNDNQVANAKNNMAQTQENGSKQVQAENVQQDSVPKTQEATDGSDLDTEKSATRAGSLQEPDNQLNTVTGKTAQHNTLESGQKTQSFNLPKNSQKLNRRVLATNLSETTSSPTTNGGFDEATWGKLDVNNWQGSAQDGVYELTNYTGDLSHIIVPNEADFEKAGRSTNGLQVGITRDTLQSLLTDANYAPKTIAFSKTNDQKVKAIGTDWSHAFSRSVITNFDGSNLDVSGVTNMRGMFEGNKISDLTSLTNWDVSSVTNMSSMFANNKISDLTGLAKWDVSNVTDMRYMFFNNSISDLRPLINWKTSNVTNMSNMFGGFRHRVVVGGSTASNDGNSISDLAPLAHWNTSKVTDMSRMFFGNKISDLRPLANWNIGKVVNMDSMFFGNKISDLTPLKNWDVSKVTNMSSMFGGNKISDLTPLANWNTGNATNMNWMFAGNSISNLTPLINWDTSKVTHMSYMFDDNPNLKDIKAIANWNMSSIDDWNSDGLFNGDMQLDLTNTDMQAFLKKHGMSEVLQGATFLTNDVDFVKANTGKTLSTLTNTAKRTILFNFPDGTSKTITQTIYYKTKAIAPAQIYWPVVEHIRGLAMMALNPPLLAQNTPVQVDPDGFTPVAPDDPNSGNFYNLKLIKIYTAKDIKASDWQLDDTHSKDNLANSITVNGQVYFKPVSIPRINGYKAHLVRNKINPAMLMVSFMAVPTENKPSTPVEVTPSKPSAPVDNPSTPFAPADNPNKPADDLQQHVITELNSNDSGWTMPNAQPANYTVRVPANATIDLSDLVIAEPVHAQTRMQIRVTKHFKLSKKHIAKYLVHRKNATRTFKKYRL